MNSRSQTSFIHFLILQRYRLNTWAKLPHIWSIRVVKAACSASLLLCITTGWMESAEFLRCHVTTGEPQGFVLDPLLLRSYIRDPGSNAQYSIDLNTSQDSLGSLAETSPHRRLIRRFSGNTPPCAKINKLLLSAEYC